MGEAGQSLPAGANDLSALFVPETHPALLPGSERSAADSHCLGAACGCRYQILDERYLRGTLMPTGMGLHDVFW